MTAPNTNGKAPCLAITSVRKKLCFLRDRAPSGRAVVTRDLMNTQSLQTQVRLLEQALVALQHQKLLGIQGARQRPQAGP